MSTTIHFSTGTNSKDGKTKKYKDVESSQTCENHKYQTF